MSKEMREQINKVKNWKQFLNESCEDGSCIPSNQFPEGKWEKLKQDSKDRYDEFIRKSGTIDNKLFDELYDNMSNKPFFGYENSKWWYDENNFELTKNEMEILKTFPVIDSINSWEEWVKSTWFYTTHFWFSKIAEYNPIITHTADGKTTKRFDWGEEPLSNKKRYFEQYNDKFGPLLVKKISSHIPK
jgi:hypothetical protein